MTDAGHAGRRATSLSLRLVAAAVVWLALMLAIGGVVLALAFRSTVEQEFSYRLDAILKAMIAATEISPDGTVTVVRPLGDPRFDQVFSGWYWEVTDPDGRQLRSRSLWDSVIAPVDGGSGLHTRRITGPNGEPLLVVERDLAFPGAKGPVHLLVAGDLREVSDGVRRFDLLLVSALGLMGLGMAIAVVIQVKIRPAAVARDGGRPAGGARRHSGATGRPLSPRGRAPRRGHERCPRQGCGVDRTGAHPCRQPGPWIKNVAFDDRRRIGGGGRQECAGEQVRTMRRLIEHHLGRASAIAGAGRAFGARVPVRPVAESISGALAKIFANKKVAIDVDMAAEVAFRGHREDLEEILGNLLENACKWATGRVRVSARDRRRLSPAFSRR